MERAYHRWNSPHLGREMELLVFGGSGERVLVFPTRGGRFYDFENWGLVNAAARRVESRELQLVCLDSVDLQTLYSEEISPEERIRGHQAYERYVLEEVLPFTAQQNRSASVSVHGCSLGAYHAVNIALRHPDRFQRAVAFSGRYDLTVPLGSYRDLFEGYYNQEIYFNNPSHFLPNMWDEALLNQLRRLSVTLAVGEEDVFCDNNLQLARHLGRLGIPHELHLWTGEAHRARDWRQMVAQYL